MQPSLASRLRMALLMTFAVYPIVVIYATIIGSLTPGWEFWQRSLILVPFMATTIVMVIVPFITRHFGSFIAGRRKAPAAA